MTYEGEFDDWQDVVRSFGAGPEGGGFQWGKKITTISGAPEKEPQEVIHASYDYESYEGSALVVYREGNRYFLVEGGHCSCYGLEGQWEPEEYDRDTLIASLDRQAEYRTRYKEALAVLKAKQAEPSPTPSHRQR